MSYHHRVSILSSVEQQTAFGVKRTWQFSRSLWAMISHVTSETKARFAQVGHSDVTLMARFRVNPHLEIADNRLKWRGQLYEVKTPTINPDTAGREYIVGLAELVSEVR